MRVGRTPVRSSQMETEPVAVGSGEAKEYDRVARLKVELPKLTDVSLKNPNPKIFRNMTDSQMGTIG
jgi:hypothetical protein